MESRVITSDSTIVPAELRTEAEPSFVLVEFIADQIGAFFRKLQENGIKGIQALDMVRDLEQELVRLAAPQIMQPSIPRITETRSDQCNVDEVAQRVRQKIDDRLRMRY